MGQSKTASAPVHLFCVVSKISYLVKGCNALNHSLHALFSFFIPPSKETLKNPPSIMAVRHKCSGDVLRVKMGALCVCVQGFPLPLFKEGAPVCQQNSMPRLPNPPTQQLRHFRTGNGDQQLQTASNTNVLLHYLSHQHLPVPM